MACTHIQSVVLVVAILCAVAPMTDGARQLSPNLEMTESLVSLHAFATGNATSNVTGCDLSRYNLDSRFTDFKEAGAGANGCVVLAKDSSMGGTLVAIKVSKKPGRKSAWEKECNGMKRLRQAACKSKEQMKLAERYLPSCLEVGGTNDAPYIIMHAAPPKGIGAVKKHLHGPVGADVFAQLVGAVTALHGVGYTHNDLHNQNIVIQMVQQGAPELSLLDFGEIVPLAQGNRGGSYKQDETVFSRIAFRLAQCPEEAFYPDVGKTDHATSSQHETRKAALVACLKKAWQIDDEFREAFVAVIDEAFKKKVPNLVPSLYHTAWVHQHQGELERKYPTPDGWCDKASTADVDGPTTKMPPHHEIPTHESIPVPKPDLEQKVADDPELCTQLCRHCSSKRQHYMCLGGPAKGGCSKSPWLINTQCHGKCTCPYTPK